ncbi:MAG: UDP-N-acetyl-D-galactosamine dehydrogenase [Candidatus Omnitrophota bacterium]|jgi:UDP-N-acetyl-D-galactosamine dehydrogenase
MSIKAALKNNKTKVAVVGLGYVGLPLAIEFGKKVATIGFDLKQTRIDDLNRQHDGTLEVTEEEFNKSSNIVFTSDAKHLREASFIIVAVPSPIDHDKKPDLSYLKEASKLVGQNLSKDAIVVFESTVYPGVTEDVCAPIIEEYSGLKSGVDFKLGYSPERINPGDKEHTVADILKIVSGQDADTLKEVADVYGLVIRAGLYEAESIKVAEAAKVIENVQRDLNIALVNELALIFQKMNIDTRAVLDAAATKWNFIKMQPGLVGGHCIGVDPYYLTYKAEEIGYTPQVILAGRRINDAMGKYVAEQTVKRMIESGKTVSGSKVIIFGITFKENVGDIRNSRVIDIINELKEYAVDVSVVDPLVSSNAVKEEYGFELIEYSQQLKADAIILAVGHDEFKEGLSVDVLKNHLSYGKGIGVVTDVKAIFNRSDFDAKDITYWRL